MKTSRKKGESNLGVKGQRYWSLMLVGEHGRVIPFRRFKEVAIAIFSIALLSLAALAVLGYFYIRQGQTIDTLRAEVNELRQHASRLKDEKDVLHAKLGLQKAMAPEPPAMSANPPVDAPGARPTDDAKSAAPTASKEVKPVEQPSSRNDQRDKPSAPSVKWGAEIQNVDIGFDKRRKALTATFRVYNRSVPKRKLAGRTVVVFKHKTDPPIKWLAVPNSSLSQGRPDGNTGQPFNINNYITMRHHAYGVKLPGGYDAAVVYVFSDEGALLASREADFSIEVESPPPAPAPAAATPSPPPPPEGQSADVLRQNGVAPLPSVGEGNAEASATESSQGTGAVTPEADVPPQAPVQGVNGGPEPSEDADTGTTSHTRKQEP